MSDAFWITLVAAILLTLFKLAGWGPTIAVWVLLATAFVLGVVRLRQRRRVP